jgi:hypothetical protein
LQAGPCRSAAAWRLYDEAGALLVVGSSLAVYSGYRFALRARREERPFAAVNLGPTRGTDDALAIFDWRLAIGQRGERPPSAVRRPPSYNAITSSTS